MPDTMLDVMNMIITSCLMELTVPVDAVRLI